MNHFVTIPIEQAINSAQGFLFILSKNLQKNPKNALNLLGSNLKYSHYIPFIEKEGNSSVRYYQIFFKLELEVFITRPKEYDGRITIPYQERLLRIDITKKGYISGIYWNLPVIQKKQKIEIPKLVFPLSVEAVYLEELDILAPFFGLKAI